MQVFVNVRLYCMQCHTAMLCSAYTHIITQHLECIVSRYMQQALCHGVSGATVVPQLLRCHTCVSLLSRLHKGACPKCLQLQYMSVVFAIMWCYKCTFQDDLVSFVSRNLSPVVPEVSLMIWGSGFLLQILSHSLDKIWLNGKPGFKARYEVSS